MSVLGRGLGLWLLVCAATPVAAQSRVEMSAGMTWTRGFDAGGADALETRNPATGSSPLTLFGTSPRVDAVAGAVASAGVYLTTNLAVEAAAEYTRPVLRTPVVADFEGATGTTVESRIKSFVVGGSLLYHFGAARLAPFVFAGAGWMRQLDEDNVLLLSGSEMHGGGGVRYRLNRHFGLRGEAGVTSREKSIAFEEKWRVLPRVAVRLTYRW